MFPPINTSNTNDSLAPRRHNRLQQEHSTLIRELQNPSEAYASRTSRLLAFLVDVVLQLMIAVPVGFGLNALGFDLSMSQMLTWGVWVVGFIYSMYFWIYRRGQTPGKRLLNLQIVRLDSQSITWGTALLRYLGYIINSLLSVTLTLNALQIAVGLGWLWILFDSRRQGLHDKLAGTVVIDHSLLF